MSGTWIKMRCALMHDPKVKAIGKFIAAQPGFAEWLSGGQICEMQTSEAALRHIVTGALHVTWSVTNEHAKGGKVSDADVTWIDTVTGIVGFGKAMESVGWVKEEGSDLIFPKFDENNTSSAERMRRHRQRHRASRVTSQERHSDASQGVTVTSHVTLEKRREEKNNINTCEGDSAKGKAKKFTPPSLADVQAYCLSRDNGIDAQAFIDHYTANGWKVGPNPMKDWQAAIRTWERSRKPSVSNPEAPKLRFLN